MNNDIDEILQYDSKFKNASQIKVDAYPMNIRKEQGEVNIEDSKIAEDDILMIETPKDYKTKFIF